MFHPLAPTHNTSLPQCFTYPFLYEAHPLCIMAAERLQKKLTQWNCNHTEQGKMYGVLIIQNSNGKLGYLWAYSGNPITNLDTKAFVPPIFDVLNPHNFFKPGEDELIDINKQIVQLEQSNTMVEAEQRLSNLKAEMSTALEALKTKNKEQKKQRQQQRENARQTYATEAYKKLEATLILTSQREKSALKQRKQEWQQRIKEAQTNINLLRCDIDLLKEERQSKSAALQQRLFDQYQLINANGEIKSLCDIFQDFSNKQPPAGTGDCAAPRLLQYAFKNRMHPLAMAEFWWGKSPISEIRKQGNYYPACRSKCEPILNHMLQGLFVNNNPLDINPKLALKIIFEDDQLLVINKPAGILSVPGKSKQLSVLDKLKELQPDSKPFFIVHRLDMATSGLMIMAKTETSYKILQAQFAAHKVKKRYEAIVEGVVKNDSGKIELPLRVDLDNRPQQQVCYEHGKSALTIWKVIKREHNTTRIAFYPITGRTHQLRVHAAHPQGLNTPIIGDELYGHKADRLKLHASKITFKHPINHKTIKLHLTADF